MTGANDKNSQRAHIRTVQAVSYSERLLLNWHISKPFYGLYPLSQLVWNASGRCTDSPSTVYIIKCHTIFAGERGNVKKFWVFNISFLYKHWCTGINLQCQLRDRYVTWVKQSGSRWLSNQGAYCCVRMKQRGRSFKLHSWHRCMLALFSSVCGFVCWRRSSDGSITLSK
jgi:hypothetical protein